jgi:hypothetical protein
VLNIFGLGDSSREILENGKGRSEPYMTFSKKNISGSHGGEYEDGCLLGCCALMMEAGSTSETSVNFYQTTLRNNPEDGCFHVQKSFIHHHGQTVGNI